MVTLPTSRPKAPSLHRHPRQVGQPALLHHHSGGVPGRGGHPAVHVPGRHGRHAGAARLHLPLGGHRRAGVLPGACSANDWWSTGHRGARLTKKATGHSSWPQSFACVPPPTAPMQRTVFSGILFFLLARLDDMQLWRGRGALDANVRGCASPLLLPGRFRWGSPPCWRSTPTAVPAG